MKRMTVVDDKFGVLQINKARLVIDRFFSAHHAHIRVKWFLQIPIPIYSMERGFVSQSLFSPVCDPFPSGEGRNARSHIS